MIERPTLAYRAGAGLPALARWVRTLAGVAAFLVLGWAVLTRSHRLLRNGTPLLMGTNYGDAVRDLIECTPSENADLGTYSVSSFAGFHVVRWPSYSPGTTWVQVPWWAVVAFVVALVGVGFGPGGRSSPVSAEADPIGVTSR